MEKTHVLLDMKNSKISKYMLIKVNGQNIIIVFIWGECPRINGSVWHMNPRYVVKTFDQQLPLSIHLVDMDTLKDTWDPLYTGYQIE